MRGKRLALASALIAFTQLTTLAAPALAQTPAAQPSGPDAVFLKDNNVIRGTLSEVVVGDHATVLLTNGQTARIMWSFIARIERNGVAQNMGAPPPVTTTTPAAPVQAAAQGSVLVHIDGSSEVTLEQQSGAGWVGVCNAPCDQNLPLEPSYRFVGSGVRASRPFRLAGQNGDRVLLMVNPGSSGAFAGGIVLTALGGPCIIIGGFTLIVVAIANAVSNSDTTTAEVVGWSLFGGGIAGLITGIVLITGNSSTKVEQALQGKTAADLFKSPRASNDAYKRIPDWHKLDTAPNTASFTFPILQQSF